METTEHLLSPPALEEIADAIRSSLQANYVESSAEVVHCPDLRKPPFQLAAEGLSGNESVADIGGESNLVPRPLLDKKYSLLECARLMKLAPDGGMVLGAGAGPYQDIGQNAELAANLSWQGGFDNVTNLTRYTMIRGVIDGHPKAICKQSPSTNCALMMNLYGSAGRPGQVLKVTCRSRKGDQESFTECIRLALKSHFGEDRQISMGGFFLMRQGKGYFHVMPDFPPEDKLPWKDKREVEKWLSYQNFTAPMVSMSVFHTADPEKLGLRIEHTHCYSGAGRDEGGHYHHDLLAGDDGATDVEYEAYFNTAKAVYRIDRPRVTK